jgi:hypothetical protein
MQRNRSCWAVQQPNFEVLGEELGAETQALGRIKSSESEDAVAPLNPINAIENCAGTVLVKPAHLTTEAKWQQTIETNLAIT